MKTTLKPAGAVVTTLAITVLWLQARPDCAAQPASAPYIPPPVSVTISPQTQGGNVSVAVQVDLPNSCHYVGSWGQPVLAGNAAYVDTQFWAITNMMCFPVIISVSTNYYLGALPLGDYTFYFRAWGMTVKAEPFRVSAPGVPRLSILRLSNAQARLSWPTNAAAYTLESAPALPAPEWTTVTNRPSVLGDEFVLAIDSAGAQMLYRLRRP